MTTDVPVDRARIRDAAACRAWLARIAADTSGRLSSVDRLLRDLACSDEPPELLLDVAEQARPLLLLELDGVLARIEPGKPPMPEADRQRFVAALGSLRRLRDLHVHLHDRLNEVSDAAARVRIPGTAESVGTVIPLARALDAQVRALLARQRLSVVVPVEEWAVLCDLAGRLRASTFMDVPLPDHVALLQPATARALFVLPLLASLAKPDTLSPPAFGWMAQLACRWAGIVGFRLEESPPAGEERHGPTVSLTSRHWVRLITHRLSSRLAACRRDLDDAASAQAAGLPEGLSLDRARALIDTLAERWVTPRSEAHAPEFRLGEMRLRFGLPGAGPSAGRRGPQPSAWSSSATRAYVYGRFEQDTLMRRAMHGVESADDLLSRWTDGARAAAWVSVERLQSVFDVAIPSGAPVLDGLALVVAPALEPAASGRWMPPGRAARARRMFGRVVSIGQRVGDDPSVPPLLRIGVVTWNTRPMAVAVRASSDPLFSDAFLLVPEPGNPEPLSVVAAPGIVRPRAMLTVREGMIERRFKCDGLLERGRGWDRVQVNREGD